ncbi:hypothetical protein CCR97_16070 [Rhodoplanes elegans]|uniref:Uncharacterized protein n=1 Tax=Rhodoplanes elegans TaxID=29408 RepID=A0A327KQL6_9BRAD|nr:hypothetical protein [Rhodoplanes elegans]MBK5959709.1 hypothetical protein [Rhodoplanes elegans]RAI40577.1 hypothetical protein CH338_05810 [Rhodoplanes elegans]
MATAWSATRAPTRVAIGLAAALGVIGPLQLGAVTALDIADPLAAVAMLATAVVVVAIVFAAATWWRWSPRVVGTTAVLLMTGLLAIGGALLGYAIWGEHTPFGRNLMLGLALFVDSVVLLPAGLSVLIHWALLRRPPAGPA